jgi:hypothetical protein
MSKMTKRTKKIADRYTDDRLTFWRTNNSDYREALAATRKLITYGSFVTAVSRGAYERP